MTVNDHRPCQNIGAFNGNPDGNGFIGPRQNVLRPLDDGRAGAQVHGVIQCFTHALGEIGFHDTGKHGRLLAPVDRRAGHFTGGIHKICIAGDPRQKLFHALEPANRRIELFPDGRIGARDTG